jgi:hypothetical protein
VDADTDVDLLDRLFLGIVGAELGLNVLCALHGVDYRGEVYQERITDGFNDVTVMLSHSLFDDRLCTASSRNMRASSAPIWRLKPTMSVNMIAASRRVSACLALSSGIGGIIR